MRPLPRLLGHAVVATLGVGFAGAGAEIELAETTRPMKRRVAVEAAMAVIAVAVCSSCNDDGPRPGEPALGQPPEPPAAVVCPPIEGYDFPVADHGAAAVASPMIEIDAGDSFFAPTCAVEVPAGRVTLRVTNTGQALHNVSVTEQGIDVDVQVGETIDVEVEVPDGGVPVVYFCKYHRTAGMVGALIANA